MGCAAGPSHLLGSCGVRCGQSNLLLPSLSSWPERSGKTLQHSTNHLCASLQSGLRSKTVGSRGDSLLGFVVCGSQHYLCLHGCYGLLAFADALEQSCCSRVVGNCSVSAVQARDGVADVSKVSLPHGILIRMLEHIRGAVGMLNNLFSLLVDHDSGQGAADVGGGGGRGGNGEGGGSFSGGGGDGSNSNGGDSSQSCNVGGLMNKGKQGNGLDGHTVVPVSELEARRRYHCTSVELVDARGSVLDASLLPCSFHGLAAGSAFTREDVEATLSEIFRTGWYDYVKGYCVKENGKGMKVVIEAQGFEHPGVARCRFIRVGSVLDGSCRNAARSRKDSESGFSMKEPAQSMSQSERLDDNGGAGAAGWSSEHQHSFSGRTDTSQDAMPLRLQKVARRLRRCLLPLDFQRDVARWLQMQGKVTVQTLATIHKKVEGWYRSNGYKYAKVKSFGGVVDGALQFNVIEGDITRLRIFHEDKNGRRVPGHTRDCVIFRELPKMVREGMPYNVDAGKAALHNIFQLRLFDKVQVTPQPDTELADDGGVMLDVVVSERPVKCAHVDTEWSFLTNDNGRPDLGTLQPGGSLFVEHRNIMGLNRSVCGSIATTNILQPQDDLRFKLEYLHPYLDGHDSDMNRTFRASCFNKRKLTAVFASVRQPPAMWVDRAGIKLNVTENFTKRSKLTYGVVLEEVATRDEASVIQNHGLYQLGDWRDLGGSGIDHLAFFQSKITRDNTTFVNGTQIGSRDVFQVDQGLGIGRNSPMFNRHQLGMTRFMLLGNAPARADEPPRVLIVHGHYGGCVGDVPRYQSFTTGGPYSLRAHNVGELSRSRHLLEVAAEVRMPVQKSQVYAYVETGADLGSVRDHARLWRRLRRGTAYGAGVYLGLVRAEYVVECGSGTGSFKVSFGERW